MSAFAAVIYRNEREAINAPRLINNLATVAKHAWHDNYTSMVACLVQLMQPQTAEALSKNSIAQFNNCILVGDVRLDNRDELIHMLSHHHHADLQHASDEHLILLGYIQWGEQVATKLIGDYVFAIWDANTCKLWCVRDVVGVMPLYYHISHDYIVVSSHVEAILALCDELSLNEELIKEHLSGHPHRQHAETVYNDVKIVPPAHTLIVKQASFSYRTHGYFEWNTNSLRYANERDYDEHFLSLFKQAVMACNRRSHPLWLSVSGGLDSSSIATVLYRNTNREDIAIYSNVTDVYEDAEESAYLQAVIDVCPSWDVITQRFEDIAWQPQLSAMPFNPMMQMIMAHQFKLMSERGYRVHLSGNGGDQVLYQAAYVHRANWWKLPYHQRVAELAYFKRYTSSWRQFGKQLVARHPSRKQEQKPKTLAQWVTSIAQRTPIPSDSITHPILKQVANTAPSLQQMYVHSTRYGIQTRNPFLDQRLIAFLIRLPMTQFVRMGQTRYIQRRAMKGILPENIRTRRTQGTIVTQLQEQNEAHFDAALTNSQLVAMGWVNKQQFEHTYQQQSTQHMLKILAFIEIEHWLRTRQGVSHNEATTTRHQAQHA